MRKYRINKKKTLIGIAVSVCVFISAIFVLTYMYLSHIPESWYTAEKIYTVSTGDDPPVSLGGCDDILAVGFAGGNISFYNISERIPVKISDLNTSGQPNRILLDGNTGYAVVGGNFTVFGLSDNGTAVSMSSIILGPEIYSLKIVKNTTQKYIYAPAGEAGLYVINVTDPYKPEAVCRFLSGLMPSDFRDFADYYKNDDYHFGFLTTTRKIIFLNLTYPHSPRELFVFGKYGSDYSPYDVSPLALFVRDATLIVYDKKVKIATIDISDPLSPYKIGGFFEIGYFTVRLLNGDLMIIINDDGLMETLNISDPSDIKVYGKCYIENYPRTAYISDDTVYVARDFRVLVYGLNPRGHNALYDEYVATDTYIMGLFIILGIWGIVAIYITISNITRSEPV